MRTKNPRVCRDGEWKTAEIIREFRGMDVFDFDGFISPPVLVDWYEDNCRGRRTWFNPKTRKVITRYNVKNKHAFEVINKQGGTTLRSNQTYATIKRWHDTTELTKLNLMLDAVQHDNIPYRKFTFHIGKELIASAADKNIPLAKVVNKALSSNLKPLFGDVEFGFWFSIEPTPEREEYPTGRARALRKDAYHAHGLFYVLDAGYYVTDSEKRDLMMKCLLKATKWDGTFPRHKWIELKEEDINDGWIAYSRKGRPDRGKYTAGYPQCPESIGKNVSSMSHSMTRRTRKFYERMRPIMNAIILDNFEEFSDDDWAKLNDGY